jgi:hypothetical protein
MALALLVCFGTLLVSLLSYAVATALIVHLVAPVLRRGRAGMGFWKTVVIMVMVSLVTALVHLSQIALWALAILLCGEIATFEDAFYCSGQNYTALGYGDFVLSGRWRLLGPLEAINGLLLFGLSTAIMFAVLSRLIANRLHPQPGFPDGAAVNPEAAGSGSKG